MRCAVRPASTPTPCGRLNVTLHGAAARAALAYPSIRPARSVLTKSRMRFASASVTSSRERGLSAARTSEAETARKCLRVIRMIMKVVHSAQLVRRAVLVGQEPVGRLVVGEALRARVPLQVALGLERDVAEERRRRA